MNEFVSNNVLFVDILGFSNLTLKEKEQAEKVLKKFKNIFNKLVKKCDSNKISYHPFSDSVVVGFKEINDALSFSKALFRKTFSKKIPLRGTIGIGEFTHKPDPYNKINSHLQYVQVWFSQICPKDII